ncbi:MAG TPA: hypothetical protein VHZ78_10510 [Rhizomicrobium sp.]|nr:hypothetical protein [Rhizomicrobium sp.]
MKRNQNENRLWRALASGSNIPFMAPKPAPESIDDTEDNSEAMAEFEKLTPEEQADYLAAIDEGFADIAAGRTVSAERVRLWIESLGTDRELPPPSSEDAARLANLDAGLADLDAGRSVPYDQVRRWLLSWGKDDELPPPECP